VRAGSNKHATRPLANHLRKRFPVWRVWRDKGPITRRGFLGCDRWAGHLIIDLAGTTLGEAVTGWALDFKTAKLGVNERHPKIFAEPLCLPPHDVRRAYNNREFPQPDRSCITSPYLGRRFQDRIGRVTWCNFCHFRHQRKMNVVGRHFVGLDLSLFFLTFTYSVLLLCSADAQLQLPTTEQFHAALATCATGLDVSISSDLVGSVTSIYSGERSNGAASFKTETKFLELFPQSDRSKVYELYTKCILKILDSVNENPETVQAIQDLQRKVDYMIRIIEERNVPELNTLIESKGLKTKYPLGFALFASNGRRINNYVGKYNSMGISFDASNITAKLTKEQFCMDGGLPVKLTVGHFYPMRLIFAFGVAVQSSMWQQ
jgi:hypothetical protein